MVESLFEDNLWSRNCPPPHYDSLPHPLERLSGVSRNKMILANSSSRATESAGVLLGSS
jgi:hypothetical protein